MISEMSDICNAVAPAAAPEVTVLAATLLTVPVWLPPKIVEVASWLAVAPAAAPLTTVESKLPEAMLTELSRVKDVAVMPPLIVASG